MYFDPILILSITYTSHTKHFKIHHNHLITTQINRVTYQTTMHKKDGSLELLPLFQRSKKQESLEYQPECLGPPLTGVITLEELTARVSSLAL